MSFVRSLVLNLAAQWLAMNSGSPNGCNVGNKIAFSSRRPGWYPVIFGRNLESVSVIAIFQQLSGFPLGTGMSHFSTVFEKWDSFFRADRAPSYPV
jgi:hypothetical protein